MGPDVGASAPLQALEGLRDAVYLLDRDWRFTYLNAEAERLVQRPREELLGRVVWDEFPEARASDLFEVYRRAAATGEHARLPDYDYPPLDTVFDIEVHPTEAGLTVQFRDVSAQVDRERNLEEWARAEQDAADELRELDDTKNAFLSAVSHELRTPLIIVQGLARQLVELRGQLDEDERASIEDEILAGADRLDQLLADLLDVDRLRRGALRTSQLPCDLAAVVRDAVRDHPLDGRVHLDVPETLEAVADPSQVERIVANLLGNAAKYAPEGTVTVTLAPLGAGARLEVRDEGPGIPDHARERIFEPLYRVDDHHPRPGTGIGLSLVAAFAQLHGGSASALPAERGAHLRVDLPGTAA